MERTYISAYPHDVNGFWKLTPKQYLIRLKVYADSRRRDEERDITHLWLGASLHRAEKLPVLDDFLKKILPDKKSSSNHVNEEFSDKVAAANILNFSSHLRRLKAQDLAK